MPSAGLRTSAHCNANFTVTATAMEYAAYLARPMPVRQAESVLTAASDTAETEVRRTRETSVAASSWTNVPYKRRTMGFAKKNSPSAHGTDSAKVNRSAYAAFLRPPSLSPRATAADTEGIAAATKPHASDAGTSISAAAPPDSSP